MINDPKIMTFDDFNKIMEENIEIITKNQKELIKLLREKAEKVLEDKKNSEIHIPSSEEERWIRFFNACEELCGYTSRFWGTDTVNNFKRVFLQGLDPQKAWTLYALNARPFGDFNDDEFTPL